MTGYGNYNRVQCPNCHDTHTVNVTLPLLAVTVKKDHRLCTDCGYTWDPSTIQNRRVTL